MTIIRRPLIYLISDGTIDDNNYETRSDIFLDLLQSAVRARIPLIQIREKQLSARRLVELAKRAALVTKDSLTKLLINERADIALAADADGVHLTSRSVLPDAIRRSFPTEFIIGVSTHSIAEIDLAAHGGADFAVYGPIFESPRKAMALGLDALRNAVNAAGNLPVVGLGGVDSSNYKQVLDSGAAGFAAIRFLNEARNLEQLHVEFDL